MAIINLIKIMERKLIMNKISAQDKWYEFIKQDTPL